jgi:uncharacterized protein
MWANLAKYILRNRNKLIAAVIAITVFMAYHAVHVQITWEFARLLPDNDTAATDYDDFKQKFGEDGAVMVIGLNDERLFKLEQFNDWYDLTYKIKEIDGIQEAVSVARLYNLVKNDSLEKFEFVPILSQKPKNQEELDSIHAVIEGLPFYDGFIINSQTKASLMAITFDRNKLNSGERIGMVNRILEIAGEFEKKHNIELHYSGMPYIRSSIASRILREMIMFIGLAFGVTIIILTLFFRSFKPVFFSMIVVLIGVIWSFGTIELLGFRITVLSGLIPPLIIVIGIPNCIMLINKYHTEYHRHGNKARSLTRMIQKIGLSTFLANFTTAIGFAVFCITNSQILVEFGRVASLNVMGAYVTSLTFIPIIFSYLAPPEEKHTQHLESKSVKKVIEKIDYWIHHYRRRVYAIVIVLSLIGIYGLTQIRAIGFVVDDLPKKDKVYVDLNFFQQNFKGVLPFEISIDTQKKGGALALNTLYKINRLQKKLAVYDEFSRPLSVVEAVKFTYQAYKGGEKKYYILPSGLELSKIGGMVTNSGKNQSTFKAFIDSNKQVTRISVQMADIGSVRLKKLLREIRPQVDSIFPPDSYDVRLTGNSVMFLKGNDYLIKNLAESFALAVILIALVTASLFLSGRMVLISLVPTIIPLLITAGLMGYFNIPLKPSTILVFSIAFGIAIDGNMHILTKFKQEIKNNHYSISKTISVTLRETGSSMIYTAIILFCGFSIFTASSFGGTAALGLLISITLLLAYLSNLILLPCFLLSMDKRMMNKSIESDSLIEVYDEEEDIELEQLKINKPEDND